MKKIKEKVCIGLIVSTVGISSTSFAAPYTVKSGDSFWKISNQFNVSLESLLKSNNANDKTVIYPGQVLEIPNGKKTIVTTTNRSTTSREIPKIIVHTVESGENLWIISQKYNVSMDQITNANEDLTENAVLNIGQELIIPISYTQVDKPIDENYGEYLDWFSDVNNGVLPIGTVFKVKDFYTGKTFTMKRTMGSYHADCEALTSEDTEVIKDIWEGFSWVRRPVLVQVGDRVVAASMTAMPHAGNDSAEGGKYTEWRSGGYGPGTNLDYIKGNGMDGHIDIHFAGSKRHKDGQIDPDHQKCIKIAAGLTK
ncbi:LysM peptidoglycan-binding domain-containing protein [Sporanaerobacter acetigenes]|uniref:LysM repeat-containing protein n=1 Tax=Sporanaerobacter acetigenes DSM 13106 TaxID=1123281 RepID=A0A1M5Y9E5_9FIRM|nr:LysM peptidoglycan-binding domain-containing protein [Sporanaerobacter acetigenes]SHI08700.1 LysM repeat-containing protein [Sporanaerobacter acetigenes DSM 13106]